MKPFSTLIEIQKDKKGQDILPIIELFKKAFNIRCIKQKNKLHILYTGHIDNPKIHVTYERHSLIIHKDMSIIGITNYFNLYLVKIKLKKYLEY